MIDQGSAEGGRSRQGVKVGIGAHSGARHAWRPELAGNSPFPRYVGEEPEPNAVRALAIDGGGIRGILPALLGAEIEDRTGKRIAELFDFIVGTSTGSI